MPFILSKQRDKDCVAAFNDYTVYLEQEKHRFPKGALELATSNWYFSFDDHRAPHDAWLESVTVSETRDEEGEELARTSIMITLLGAYHDGYIQFVYSGVVAYSMKSLNLANGHCDWRFDEFRLSEAGNLIHEIEWWGSGEHAIWIIEASDVHYSWHPLDVDTPDVS